MMPIRCGRSGCITSRSNKATRISSGHDNEFSPVFDPEGKHLYFIANRHENPVLSEAEFDASNLKSTGIYVATLQKETASPFAPRSDEGAVEPGQHDSKAVHATAEQKRRRDR
jgi:tricorn protease